MAFRKIEDLKELACVLKKIDNRKARKIFHNENLMHIKRVKEIESKNKSKNIPKDRRFERIQIMMRLKKKFENRSKKAN